MSTRWDLMLVAGGCAAAVVGFELALLRMVLVASWHHFAFLVVALAMLGFGASGTVLTLLRERLLANSSAALLALSAATCASIPVCAQLAQHLPVEARIAPGILGWQLAAWLGYWTLLGLPFLLGASAIGLALMTARERVAEIYAANLLGSGLGGLLVTLGMYALPPELLPLLAAPLALPGVLALSERPRLQRGLTLAAVAVATGGFLALDPPTLRVDPYKGSAHVQRIEARLLASGRSPRAEVGVFASSSFHALPFLSGAERPPPLHSILIDGHPAGSLLDVAAPEEARAVEGTLMAFPFALARSRPRVLLLGETGSANVWLAVRHRAEAIDVVQPDPTLWALLRGPLRERGGAVLSRPELRGHPITPRAFVDHAPGPFDLIQLAGLESTAPSAGLAGLGEDHLVTVEGFAACLRLLAADGVLAISRGIQSPPRDNLKLLATLATALRQSGAAAPSEHVVVVRDFLGVCTLVKASPWTDRQLAAVARRTEERNLTPVWWRGVPPGRLNQPDALPGPAQGGDWYHHGARALLGTEEAAQRFVADWRFDIRPPTDDRPFFRDMCRLSALGALRAAYGEQWLAHSELAFLFVLATLLVIGLTGAACTVLPLALLRPLRRSPGRAVNLLYFTSLGLGYMLLEMTLLSRFGRLLGDPVLAASLTITCFLLASGAGSLLAQRLGPDHVLPRRAAAGVAALGALLLLSLPLLLWLGGALPPAGRVALLLLATLPLAFLMGFPMPRGLACLDDAAPHLLPWAWGVNGFASVLAPPLATLLAMSWGFSLAGGLAVLSYALAAALAPRLR